MFANSFETLEGSSVCGRKFKGSILGGGYWKDDARSRASELCKIVLWCVEGEGSARLWTRQPKFDPDRGFVRGAEETSSARRLPLSDGISIPHFMRVRTLTSPCTSNQQACRSGNIPPCRGGGGGARPPFPPGMIQTGDRTVANTHPRRVGYYGQWQRGEGVEKSDIPITNIWGRESKGSMCHRPF